MQTFDTEPRKTIKDIMMEQILTVFVGLFFTVSILEVEFSLQIYCKTFTEPNREAGIILASIRLSKDFPCQFES